MGGADSELDMAERLAAQGARADAEALVRFALSTDPDSARGHVMLAQIRAAKGNRNQAVAELVDAARRRANAGADDPTPLYTMLAGALELDPSRLELHVDLAELQATHGDIPGARARLDRLSAVYASVGRHADASSVRALIRRWATPVRGAVETPVTHEESIEILLEDIDETVTPEPRPRREPKMHTVCTPTLLRDATGSIVPNQEIVPAPSIRRRRAPRAATVCTPTLLRDAKGEVLPNQAGIPKPALRKTKRPSTGRERTLPRPKTSIRPMRTRIHPRTELPTGGSGPLALRLRKLGQLTE